MQNFIVSKNWLCLQVNVHFKKRQIIGLVSGTVRYGIKNNQIILDLSHFVLSLGFRVTAWLHEV